MHFHADHSLFFERPQQLWRPATSLALTVCVLIANAGWSSMMASVLGSCAGACLLVFAYSRGHRRMEPAIAWTLVLVASAVLGSLALQSAQTRILETVARVSCGVLWILWLGTQLDWSSLRQLLLAARVPTNVVGSLDHAVMSGVLTKKEWIQRRDSARIRIGSARLPFHTWGHIIGVGALGGFLRLESAEENALLRGACRAVPVQDDALCLRNISVERSGKLILEHLDLHIGRGEWLLLCGPSGAGKSTLLRLLAGLNNPLDGTMNRLGVNVSPGSPLNERLDGRVALLTQNPEHHFIASTVAEDIAWGLRRRGIDAEEAQSRSKEMATTLCVDHLLTRPCHTLSFGEQRRVALAGLLVLEPDLLLLDEPTSGLDPVAAYELRQIVNKLVQHAGTSCVWATHDLHSLPPQAERMVLLRNGKMVFDGPTSEGLSDSWLVQAGLMAPNTLEPT